MLTKLLSFIFGITKSLLVAFFNHCILSLADHMEKNLKNYRFAHTNVLEMSIFSAHENWCLLNLIPLS